MNRGTLSKRAQGPSMRIGDVATRAGVNTQTLRYYERRGILGEPKRSASGYREYPIDTVRLIRFIKRAQELGFTLAEVEELITLRQTTPKRRAKVRELAAARCATSTKSSHGCRRCGAHSTHSSKTAHVERTR